MTGYSAPVPEFLMEIKGAREAKHTSKVGNYGGVGII